MRINNLFIRSNDSHKLYTGHSIIILVLSRMGLGKPKSTVKPLKESSRKLSLLIKWLLGIVTQLGFPEEVIENMKIHHHVALYEYKG